MVRRRLTTRFVSFFLLSCSICFIGVGKSLSAGAILPPAEVSVSPLSVTIPVYQNFTINVTVTQVSDVYGWEIELTWNSTLLDPVNVSEGPFLKAGGATFFTSQVNAIDGSMIADCTLMGTANGVNGKGTFATITFYVKNAGECPLHLNEAILISSTEQSIQCQTADGYGYFTALSDAAIPGDLNGDFKVNLEDLVLLAQAYGSKPGYPNWNPNADIDNSGVVGLSDLVILALHYGQQYP
jgi:hypothetical protein